MLRGISASGPRICNAWPDAPGFARHRVALDPGYNFSEKILVDFDEGALEAMHEGGTTTSRKRHPEFNTDGPAEGAGRPPTLSTPIETKPGRAAAV